MSLFGSLFAQPAGSPGSGLFSSSSKFAAAPAATAPPVGGAKQQSAPAAAVAGSGGGGKKRRQADKSKDKPLLAPAAAPAAKDKPSKKKARKAEQEQQQQQQQRQQREKQAAAAEAAAAAAAAAAGDAEERPAKKAKKGKKQQAQQQAPEAAEPKASKPGKAKGKDAKPAAAKQPAEAQPAAKPAAKGAKGGSSSSKAGAVEEPAAVKGTKRGGKAAGDDGDERLPRTVFVGNLPSDVKRKAVSRLFAGCGAVETVRLRSLPIKQDEEGKAAKLPKRAAVASGAVDAQHSGHAYVVFEEEAAVEAALALNMTEWNGRHVRVDRAAPRAAKGAVQFDPARSLFVGNLAHTAEDEELIRHFGGGGAVEAVRLVRDARSGAGKGVAFVLFRTQEASRAALKGLQGRPLGGRKLRLERAQRSLGGGKDGKAAWQQGKQGSGGKDGAGGKPSAAKRSAGGKRPAVAARKAAERLAAKGGVQKKKA